MEHRHRASELRLYRRLARHREIHLAEFARITRRVLVLGGGWRDERDRHYCKKHGATHTVAIHVVLPF